jgi:electron transfer flavoprotein alpha subunit
MGQVLVLVDDEHDGTVRRSTGVLLTIARRLGEPVAVCRGGRPTEATIRVLGRYGAVGVCAVGDAPATSDAASPTPVVCEETIAADGSASTIPAARCEPSAPRTAAPSRASLASTVAALAILAERRSPTAILIAAGYSGQEIAGRLAVRLDAGVITDAVDVRPSPEGPVAVQSCLAHSYLVESRVRRGVPVITVRPAAATPTPSEALVDPAVESVSVPASPELRTPRVVTVTRPPEEQGSPPALATADVVVAGGRGVGSAEAFSILAGIAEALGGAVGGTHTATELGWCPRERRIGLTGQTVHPRLYLATGVSGSVRHRAGMQGAKTVVAIGDDPAAPIFRLADLGVVGDLHDVLPALLAEMRRRRARSSPGALGEADPIPDLTEA